MQNGSGSTSYEIQNQLPAVHVIWKRLASGQYSANNCAPYEHGTECALAKFLGIVRQNLLLLPLHTSLARLGTVVWCPLCAAFQLIGSGSACQNIASEINGTQSPLHCLNVYINVYINVWMAYLPVSWSYQVPSKDVFISE